MRPFFLLGLLTFLLAFAIKTFGYLWSLETARIELNCLSQQLDHFPMLLSLAQLRVLQASISHLIGKQQQWWLPLIEFSQLIFASTMLMNG